MSSDKQRELLLLESFIVDNEDLEELEAKLAEFNIFEAIGVRVMRLEKIHSNLLAFLLDRSQNHGLSDIFLKEFLKRVLLETDNPTDSNYAEISPVDMDIANFEDAEVKREWQNIDILIHSPRNRLICAIENKIDSREHSNQLERYQNIINRDIEYKNYRKILIYLTREGSTPSQANWIIYSYSQILEIIDSIRTSDEYTLSPDISTLMKHYSTFMRTHIVSDSEIAKLCQKIYFEHRQAINLINEHRPSLQSEIDVEIQKLLNPLIIESKEIFVHCYTEKGKSFPRCRNFGDELWDIKFGSQLLIYFQFENIPDSLTMRLKIGYGDDRNQDKEIRQKNAKNRQKLWKLLQKQEYLEYFKQTKLLASEITLYEKPILKKSDYEDDDIEKIIKKIQDFWDDFSKKYFVHTTQIISKNIEMILKDN